MKLSQAFRIPAAGLALTVLAASAVAAPAPASQGGPMLVIALHTRPADRPALRRLLAREQADHLRAWQAQGVLAGYRLLFTRQADSGVWDAMEILRFRDSAGPGRWSVIERGAVAGLPADAAALVNAVETVPVDSAREGGQSVGPDAVTLAIPYSAQVPPAQYRQYLDGYTLPQFRGWTDEGVLADYRVMTATYPAARPWNALILLRYKNDAALSHREDVVAKVRARLALDPTWKAISDDKKQVRTEGVIAIADEIAAADMP